MRQRASFTENSDAIAESASEEKKLQVILGVIKDPKVIQPQSQT